MVSQKRLTALIEAAAQACGSQAELARRLGVARSAISNWRSGLSGPRWEYLVAMQDIAKRAACVLLAVYAMLHEGGACVLC